MADLARWSAYKLKQSWQERCSGGWQASKDCLKEMMFLLTATASISETIDNTVGTTQYEQTKTWLDTFRHCIVQCIGARGINDWDHLMVYNEVIIGELHIRAEQDMEEIARELNHIEDTLAAVFEVRPEPLLRQDHRSIEAVVSSLHSVGSFARSLRPVKDFLHLFVNCHMKSRVRKRTMAQTLLPQHNQWPERRINFVIVVSEIESTAELHQLTDTEIAFAEILSFQPKARVRTV